MAGHVWASATRTEPQISRCQTTQQPIARETQSERTEASELSEARDEESDGRE